MSYKIHELPPEPAKNVGNIIDPCLTTKKLFNPLNIVEKDVPPAGIIGSNKKRKQHIRVVLGQELRGKCENFATRRMPQQTYEFTGKKKIRLYIRDP